MADTKISALTAATTPLAGTEVLPIVQSGVTKKVTIADLTAGRAVSAASYSASSNASAGTFNGLLTLSDGTYPNSGLPGIKFNTFGAGNGYSAAIYATQYSSVVIATADTYGGTYTASMTFANGNPADITFHKGNLIQGTAAKGINFTANTPAAGKTSQLLNWYEEGTWTPSIANSFNNYTHTIQVGRYTRVGNLVTVQFTIAWTTTNAGGFSFVINGLPFTPVTLTNYASGGSIGKVDRLTTIKQVMCQVESATASIKFYELNTGAAATALASASWNVAGSANLVSGTVTYQV